MDADITGLSQKAQDGWEERAQELCKPQYFWTQIYVSEELIKCLSPEEQDRLGRDLDLVSEVTSYMAAGMLKGILKYGSGDRSVESWLAHLIGEGADQMNYQILLADAYRRAHAQDETRGQTDGLSH